jgi:glutamate 5-kinase
MIRIDDFQGTGRTIELRKLVVKLGSAVVTGEGYQIDEPVLAGVADTAARLRDQGVQTILVSSGSIAMGRRACVGFVPRTIPDRQALAAIGQVGLMHAYKRLFNERGLLAAQVLLTRGDMESRGRYLNARYTMERLLDLGAVPVVNENDTVTVDELKFGDNDELSALVATKMDADLLVILSVADGLHARLPARGEAGDPIPVVEHINGDVLGLVDGSLSISGTGGMSTKLEAMRMVTHAGVHGIIAAGKSVGILDAIVGGRFRGTYFMPSRDRRMPGKTRWIAYGRKPRGRLIVDDGARAALVERKKSLLAAGVRGVEGIFDRGELVEIADPSGHPFARGLVSYSSAEIDRIKGENTAQIKKLLGTVDYKEVVHRDNMAFPE